VYLLSCSNTQLPVDCDSKLFSNMFPSLHPSHSLTPTHPCRHQAGEIKRPNAPLARDPWACARLYDATLAILKRDVDPNLPHADISPDGQEVSCQLVRPSAGLGCFKAQHVRQC
jgi:hypothetical protein